jgi:hypothetical protein
MRNSVTPSNPLVPASPRARRLWLRAVAGSRAAAVLVACLAALMVTAGGAPAVAYPASSDFEFDFSPLASFPALAPTSATGGGSLLAKQIAVLTGQGISPTRALQAINLQTAVAATDLQSKLGEAMGNAYAGVWLEPSAAKVDIGVTSPSSRAAAERVLARTGLAARAIFTPVRATFEQLVVTQNVWNRKLAGPLAHGNAAIGLEPQYNRVGVGLSSSVPAKTRKTLEHAASTSRVDVVVTVSPSRHLWITSEAAECNNFPPANCEPSITAGVHIFSPSKCVNTRAVVRGGRRYRSQTECEERRGSGSGEWERQGNLCTAGPAAIPEANRRLRVLLTAGHCLQTSGGERENWFAYNRREATALKLIGAAGRFTLGRRNGDFGEINIEAGGWWETGNPRIPVYAVSALWKETEETRYPVVGDEAPVARAVSCHEGATSGGSCGEIRTLNITRDINIQGEEEEQEELTEEAEEEAGGGLFTVSGLVEVYEPSNATERLIGRGGDSGGPWLVANDFHQVTMEGTNVGRLEPECPRRATVLTGPQFFGTLTACLQSARNPESPRNSGEYERRLVLIFFPLVAPTGQRVEGSLRALRLELLTTDNENRARELEEEEKREKEESGLATILSAKEQTEWTGKNVGEPVFEAAGGDKIKCTSAKVEGTLKPDKDVGTLHADYEGCQFTSLGLKCNSTGDATGVILLSGWWKSVVYEKEPELGGAILFEPSEVKLECSTFGKVTIKGDVLCPVSRPKSSEATHEFHCEGEKGKTKHTEYYNGKGVKVKIATLLVSLNSGAFEEAAEIGSGTQTFKEAVEIMA